MSPEDSQILAALEDHPLSEGKRVQYKHHKPLQYWLGIGGAVFGFLSVFAGGVMAYKGLCKDVEAVQNQGVKHAETIQTHTQAIQKQAVVISRIDTRQATVVESLQRIEAKLD